MVPQFLRPIPNHPSYLISEYGKVWSDKRGRFIKPSFNINGYLRVEVDDQKYTVHRLVARLWLPNPHNLPVVHHKDSDILNNHYSNLQWTTIRNNTLMGRSTKLSDEDVENIKELYSTGQYSQRDLADMFNVSQRTVCNVCNNRR